MTYIKTQHRIPWPVTVLIIIGILIQKASSRYVPFVFPNISCLYLSSKEDLTVTRLTVKLYELHRNTSLWIKEIHLLAKWFPRTGGDRKSLLITLVNKFSSHWNLLSVKQLSPPQNLVPPGSRGSPAFLLWQRSPGLGLLPLERSIRCSSKLEAFEKRGLRELILPLKIYAILWWRLPSGPIPSWWRNHIILNLLINNSNCFFFFFGLIRKSWLKPEHSAE